MRTNQWDFYLRLWRSCVRMGLYVWTVFSTESKALTLTLLYQPGMQPQRSSLTSLNLSFLIYQQNVIPSSLPTSQFYYNDWMRWYTWTQMTPNEQRQPMVSNLWNKCFIHDFTYSTNTLDTIIGEDSMDMSLSKLQQMVEEREAWHTAVHRVTKRQTWQSDWAPTAATTIGEGVF